MKNFILFISLFIGISVFAQERSIEFRDVTFDEALVASKKEGKPIFMDCYAVWCGPCKWMSANIFTKNEVADFYNKNFICVKFDMEKGEGIDIAKEFGVRAYPTLIYVNAERKLVMKSIGASQAIADYITLGENAKSDNLNLIALAENVAANRKNASYMQSYFTIMSGAEMVDQKEVSLYFNGIPKASWTSTENWKIIRSVVDDILGDVFQDVLANTQSYRENNGEEVDQFIDYKVQNALMTALYSRSENANANYQALLGNVQTWNFVGKDEIIFTVESKRMQRSGADEYMAYCVENASNFVWDDANQLNSIAWFFFENTDDKNYLATAETWAARAVELDPSHAILDTYANLLFVNGKPKEALETETKALELAKEEGVDTESYQAVIDKINAAN